MAEYIEREVVLNAITADGFEHFSGCLSSSEVRLIELMRDSVSEIPAADVALVVRGRWDFLDDASSKIVKWNCDRCNRISTSKTDYCPNCGARMEG